MTIEALQEKRATLLATARELAAGDGDMARVKSLMAESEEVGQRIEAIKSLGELAPKPTNVASSEPWSRGGVTKNVFSGTRDEANRKAYTMGQIALSLMGNGKASNWLKENGIKAQSEGTNNVGGFLVPDPLSSDLIYLREQFGIARRYCRVYPMTSDVQLVPNATVSTQAYYPGENTAITTSDMTFAQVSLTAKKMAILTQVSKELNEDSVVDIGSMLARDMAYVMAREEDRVLFNSTYKTGTPAADASGLQGIPRTLTEQVSNTIANYGNAGGIVLGGTTGNVGAFANFTLANLQTMVGRLPTYADNPVWFMHKNFFFQGVAQNLANLSGNAISDIQNAYGPNPTLFGYPVVFVQVMEGTNALSQCNAILGDLGKGVLFGDRRGITIEVSDQRYFVEDSLAFKATERYSINCFDAGTANATPSSRTTGSFVALFAQAT